MERLNLVDRVIDQLITFNEQVYLPDVAAIGSFYKGWLYGGGLSGKSVLAYGDVPENANDYSAKNLLLPRGAIINGNLNEIFPSITAIPNEIQEFVTHSWYRYPDETQGLHPWDGITEPNYQLGPNAKGTKTDIRARRRPANIPGSRPRAGVAMRWRSGRWRAGSSAMPRTSRSSRSRSINS